MDHNDYAAKIRDRAAPYLHMDLNQVPGADTIIYQAAALCELKAADSKYVEGVCQFTAETLVEIAKTKRLLKYVEDATRARLELDREVDVAQALNEMFAAYDEEAKNRAHAENTLESMVKTVSLKLTNAMLRGPEGIIERVDECVAEVKRLRVIEGEAKTVCSQRADDLCWMALEKLAVLVGVNLDMRVGDKAAMLENCRRFIDVRCREGGWPSYADLEAMLREVADEAHKGPDA